MKKLLANERKDSVGADKSAPSQPSRILPLIEETQLTEGFPGADRWLVGGR